MTTQFRVLGAVEAHVDGRAVDLGPARQRCVLVALLVDANHVVPVEQLMNRVWGRDLAPRGTLYSHVSRLRRALTGAADVEIARRSGGYLLTVDPMSVDLHRFRHLIELARRTSDPAHYARANGLWRGEAFADLESPWIDQLRASLHLERRAAQLDCNDLLLQQGKHAEVLKEFAAGRADHHLDERLAGQLMLALYRAGRRADALQAYQDTRTALVEELGLEPGPELQALHRRMLADDVDAGPRARLVVAVAGPTPTMLGSHYAERVGAAAAAVGDSAGVGVSMHWIPLDRPGELERIASDRSVHGVVLVNTTAGLLAAVPRALRGRVVSIGIGSADVPAVDVDNAGAAAAMMRHLLANGRRSIAMITGPRWLPSSCSWRMVDAYRDAVREVGAPERIVHGGFDAADGRAGALEAMHRWPDTDAIFAICDATALGAIAALRGLGVQVPGDVAVAGFDDVPAAAWSGPTLTTATHPVRSIATIAATALLEGGPHEPHTWFPSELVLREST